MANTWWEIIASFAYDLVVYGVIVTLIVTAISEILGTDLRYRIRRRKRRFMK